MHYYLFQIGGGSLRIYKREVQQKVLEIIGISLEQVRRTLSYSKIVLIVYCLCRVIGEVFCMLHIFLLGCSFQENQGSG